MNSDDFVCNGYRFLEIIDHLSLPITSSETSGQVDGNIVRVWYECSCLSKNLDDFLRRQLWVISRERRKSSNRERHNGIPSTIGRNASFRLEDEDSVGKSCHLLHILYHIAR